MKQVKILETKDGDTPVWWVRDEHSVDHGPYHSRQAAEKMFDYYRTEPCRRIYPEYIQSQSLMSAILGFDLF